MLSLESDILLLSWEWFTTEHLHHISSVPGILYWVEKEPIAWGVT